MSAQRTAAAGIAGSGIGRLVAAPEEADREPDQPADQRNLEQEPENRREAAQPTEEAAPEQHADQAGAQQAAGETAEESTVGRGCRTLESRGGAGLPRRRPFRRGALHRGGRPWGRIGRRGRFVGPGAPAAEIAVPPGTGVDRRRDERQDGGKGGWITRAEEFMAPRYRLSEAEHRQRTSAWA